MWSCDARFRERHETGLCGCGSNRLRGGSRAAVADFAPHELDLGALEGRLGEHVDAVDLVDAVADVVGVVPTFRGRCDCAPLVGVEASSWLLTGVGAAAGRLGWYRSWCGLTGCLVCWGGFSRAVLLFERPLLSCLLVRLLLPLGVTFGGPPG